MLRTDQQPIATCTNYVLYATSFANKVDILHEEQNIMKISADLKLQHRITKANSFSKYLENAKSPNGINVAIFVQKCSVKKMLLGISKNQHENTCAEVSF